MEGWKIFYMFVVFMAVMLSAEAYTLTYHPNQTLTLHGWEDLPPSPYDKIVACMTFASNCWMMTEEGVIQEYNIAISKGWLPKNTTYEEFKDMVFR